MELGDVVCRLEAWAEVVQQLTKLMATSIFSTDTVSGRGSMGNYVGVECGGCGLIET